jgi:hypothetical protein
MSALASIKAGITEKDITLALLTGAGLSFLTIWNLYPYLGNGQEYKDLVVGALIWSDYDKDQEWKALNFLFAGFVFFSLAMAALFHTLRTRDIDGKRISAVQQLLWFAWLPAVFWFGTALMRPHMPVYWLNLSGILILLFVLLSLRMASHPHKVSPDDLTDAGFSMILLLLLGFFAVLAVIVVASQYSLPLRTLLLNKGSEDVVIAGIASVLGFIFWNLFFIRSLPSMKRRFHQALLLLQIPQPLLLFVTASQHYFYQGSMVRMYHSTALGCVLVALVLFSWYRLYRRYRTELQAKRAGGSSSYIDLLSPACLYPIAVYIGWVFFSWKTFSFAIDDFHIGEQLLPWQQIVDFGKLPYADFAPVHGLMALAYGGLNAWFYDGTVATFPQAMLLLMAVFTGLSFWSIHSFAGPWPALLLTPLFGVILDRMFILIPVLLAFCQLFSGKYKFATWLPLWILLSFISVFYNVPVGAGLVLGSMPMLLYRGWPEFRKDKIRRRWFIYSALACMLAIIVISPLRGIIFGFLHFILDNSSTNTIANGSGMLQKDMRPEEVGFAATQFQWDFLKLSWIVIAVSAVVLLSRTLVGWERRPDSKYIALVALIPLTFFMISRWSFGRIDANEFLGRDGTLSFLSLAFFLPLMLVGFGAESARALRSLASALVVGVATGVAGIALDYNALLAKPFLTDAIDERSSLVSGKDIGLPRLGKLFADPKRIDELQSLRRAMAPFLKPSETFLDLTNRSALYYYLDLPVPVVYSSDYVAANAKSLVRMIQQIKQNPPPLVLIAPRITFDGGPASLRSYLLYKELVVSYIPRLIGEHSFLIRPDRLPPDDRRILPEQMAILDSAFRARDLYGIPNVWGRSWELLKNRFTVVQRVHPTKSSNFTQDGAGSYRPTGEDPHLLFDIGQYHIAGKEVDFLLVDYSCTKLPSGPDPILELYWNTENDPQNENTVLRFFGSGTKALIPVGAQPRWLLAKHIDSFRLDLQHPGSCGELRLNRVEMLKLN